MQNRLTFKKEERLCSKTVLDSLFAEGKSVFAFPCKILYIPTEHSSDFPIQVVFSVPKRNFKHAVKRNLIRRRMREAYRLNKEELYSKLAPLDLKLAVMVLYIEKEVKDYKAIEKGMKKGLKKLAKVVGAQ